jgi:hypothetical protein
MTMGKRKNIGCKFSVKRKAKQSVYNIRKEKNSQVSTDGKSTFVKFTFSV